MALVLTATSLFIFNVNSSKVSGEIINSRVLDLVYFKQNLINFYVQEAFENSKSFDDFKNILNNYNNTIVGKDLEKIGEGVERDFSDKLLLKIEISEEYEGIIIRYLYEKEFAR